MGGLDRELCSLREEDPPQILPRHPETALSPSFGSLSKRVEQQVRRRLAVHSTTNRTLDRLEGMLGGRFDSKRAGSGSRLLGGPLFSSLSDRTLKGVTDDVVRFSRLQRSCPCDAKEALRELTLKVANYGTRADVAAYGEAPFSLPPAGCRAVEVEDVLPAPVARPLGSAASSLLRESPDMESAAKAYWDPALIKDEVSYADFVKQLLDRSF